MSKRKILQTFVILVILFTTIFGWGSYRIALATEEGSVSEMTATELDESEEIEMDVFADTSTEDASTGEEVNTEETSESVDETGTENDSENSTEADSTEETTDEVTTEEGVVGEDSTETSTEVTTEETTTADDEEEIEESIDQMNDTKYYVYQYMSFGNGHFWHRVDGKDVFCLREGYNDTGTYWTKKDNYTYGSASTSYRIATAMLWYQKNGASVENYKAAQNTVWNFAKGGTDAITSKMDGIKNAANHLYNVYSTSNLNSLKKVTKSGNSYTGSLKSISKPGTKYELSVSNDHLQYAISKGYVKVADTVKSSNYSGTVKTEIKEKKITFTFDPALQSGQTVKVYFKIAGDYFSDGKITFYEANNRAKQDFGETASKITQYRGIQFKGGGHTADYPTFVVNKTNIDGGAANADYKLVWYPWSGNATQTPVDFGAEYGMTFSNSETVEIEEYAAVLESRGLKADDSKSYFGAGHYYLYEIDTDDNLVLKDPNTYIGHFMVHRTKVSSSAYKFNLYWSATDGTALEAGWTGGATVSDTSNVVKGYFDASFGDVNLWPYGSVSLHKTGEVLVGYEKGADDEISFTFQSQNIPNVSFQIVTDSTVQAGQYTWAPGTVIPNGTVWSAEAGCTVSYSGVTDANGILSAAGLPIGDYHFEEVWDSDYFLKSSVSYPFSIIRNNLTELTGYANTTPEVVNQPLNAGVTIIKEDVENNQKLPGAKFNLYASIKNKDYAGNQLFPDSLATEAVVARDLEKGTETKEGGWVFIQQITSGDDGTCKFKDIPYGDYMVVEVKPPKDYSLPSESWKFTHTKANGATIDVYATSVDYSHTFTFGNTEKANIITVFKHGNTVVSSEDSTNEYGTYKKLVTEDVPIEGVNFAVYNEEGGLECTFTTDKDGKAQSSSLPKGTYYVQEVSADAQHKVSTEQVEVKLEADDETKTVEFTDLDFDNELISTSLALYKNGEVPYVTNTVLEDPIQYAGVTVEDENSAYTFNVEPLAGAVFGVYATEDLKNYKDEVVVATGECVGYAVSNESGVAVLNEQLIPGNYSFKELSATDEYRLDEGEYTFTLQAYGADVDLQVNPMEPVINVHTKSAMKLIKLDGDTEKPLEGVEFELYNSDDVLIGTYVTDKNGEIYVADVPLGTYYFVETQPLDGYFEYTDEIVYDVKEDGMLYTIKAYNDLIPDKPKLGTFGLVDTFCTLLMLLCACGLAFIWLPMNKIKANK